MIYATIWTADTELGHWWWGAVWNPRLWSLGWVRGERVSAVYLGPFRAVLVG